MTKLDLVVEFKLMPDGVETDLDKVKDGVIETVQKVAPDAKLQGFQTKPVAFGLKALHVTVLTSDSAGGPDALEEAFNEIEGVVSAQVEQLGRI